MKKYLIALIAALGILAGVRPVNADVIIPVSEIYARAFAVIGVAYGDDGINLITMQDCNGEVFEYWDDEPLYVGDIVSCVMYDNGTAIVADDIVLDGSYDRPDLLIK